jgi:lincosamide nucleotidyltransferase A/C/D/E
VELGEVVEVLAALAGRGCPAWVGGGWGVDALVGHQTRPHRDLDLAIDARWEWRAIAALARVGYQVQTDWRPVRVELSRPGAGWVDLHPVTFDDTGHGRQHDLDGGWFDYPAGCLTTGHLDRYPIPCLSIEQQIRFHTGYPPRDIDRHDLALLHQLTRPRH